MSSISTLTVEQHRQVANASLEYYIHLQMCGFVCSDHHRLTIKCLEDLERGEITRLIICMPPRHSKTLTANELFSSWWFGKHPDHEIMATTYSQERADDNGRKVRNRCQGKMHRTLFPGCVISKDSEAVNRFNTTTGGAYYGIGVGGPATGRGANLLLIDDPFKNREEADSETRRKHIKRWYSDDIYTRLMPGGRIVVIMTRWHEDDLVGWLLDEHQHENWHVLRLPALAEDDDQLGRKRGEPLWPSFFPLERLEKIKKTLGERSWNALYQQRPAPEEGNIFKRRWFHRRYDYRNPPKFIRIINSWDTATSEEEDAAWSVGEVWGEALDGFYLLNVVRAQVEFPELLKMVRTMYNSTAQKPSAVLVEDKSSGRQVCQTIRRDSTIPIIPINPPKGYGKVVRAKLVSPICEAERVVLPYEAPWLPDYEDELFMFPNSKNADQVDAKTQALSYLTDNTLTAGMDLS